MSNDNLNIWLQNILNQYEIDSTNEYVGFYREEDNEKLSKILAIFHKELNNLLEYLNYRLEYGHYTAHESRQLIKLIEDIEKLKKAKFFNTWITRILINVSIDFLKKKGKNEMLDESTPIRKEKCEISTEEKLDLYNAIDLLNDNYKTVIIMMYFNDMKIKDISKVMEIPENTVKTYLRRAKQALGEVLKEGYLNE